MNKTKSFRIKGTWIGDIDYLNSNTGTIFSKIEYINETYINFDYLIMSSGDSLD